MSLINQMRDAVGKACEASLPGIHVGEGAIFARVLSRVYVSMPQLHVGGANQQFFANDDLSKARILLSEEIRKSLAFIYPGSFLVEQEPLEEPGAVAVLG